MTGADAPIPRRSIPRRSSLRRPGLRPVVRGQCGNSSVEMAILLPVIVLILFAVIQSGIFAFGKSVAAGAAESAAQAAALEQGTTADAIQAAYDMIDAGGTLLSTPGVVVNRTTTTVTVTVNGNVPSVVPFINSLPVSQTVSYPVERITRP